MKKLIAEEYNRFEDIKQIHEDSSTNEEFAIFQNAGYMGLYGGLDVDDIHTKKGLEVGQKII